MKIFLLLLFIAIPSFLMAQVPQANSLVQLHAVRTAERNSISGVVEGSLIFDSDEQAVYTYTSSNGWVRVQKESNTYVGSFILSAASGSISITNIPFTPAKITFEAHANIEGYNIDADNGVADNTYGIQNSFGSANGFAIDDGGTIAQQMIYSGGHGNSINDITRFSSNQYCIGIRYGSQNGNDLGKIFGQLTSFDTNGFTILAGTSNGTITVNSSNPRLNVQVTDVQNESIVVLYTAYR